MFALIALSRIAGLSLTWWDWDEMLFMNALREYDVVKHHPHPPGFPLYILAGKLVRPFVTSDFQALQAISFVASALVAPLLCAFALEIGFVPLVAVAAGAIFAFMPTVWLYGGMALSDIPSVALVLGASVLLLRGRRSNPALYAGFLLVGIAAGFRPQNLIIGCAPALIALAARGRRGLMHAVAGGCLVAVVVAAAYGGAAWASGGFAPYRQAVAEHGDYIARVDSFRSPDRPALHHLVDNFFILHYGDGAVSWVLTALVAVAVIFGAVHRSTPVFMALATFGPFAVFAWLSLDVMSARRFALGYMPLFALLIADGIWRIASRSSRRAAWFAMSGVALIVAGLIAWGLPAVWRVHTTVSPPAEAVDWIRGRLDAKSARVFAVFGLEPFAEYALPGFTIELVRDERAIPMIGPDDPPSYLFAEGALPPPAINFSRSRRGRLWDFVRHRYFEVSVVSLHSVARFLEGWYEAENEGLTTWRWMSGRARVELPEAASPTALVMTFQVPMDVLPKAPTITVRLNGSVVERFRAESGLMQKRWKVQSRPNEKNLLEIETDGVVNPRAQGVGEDSRDLGLLLKSLEWGR